MNTATPPADAELLIASGCSHCPAVLSALAELVKQGLIGRLDIINVGSHPEQAQLRNARAVPWTQIGPFVLPGDYSRTELQTWAERASSAHGMSDYFAELLENQRIDEALALVERDPGQLSLLVRMMSDLQTPMGVRIGIGAMFEDLAERSQLDAAIPLLAKLTRADTPQVRADAAYYLGLIGKPAVEWIRPLLDDPDHEVREIASEALSDLAR